MLVPFLIHQQALCIQLFAAWVRPDRFVHQAGRHPGLAPCIDDVEVRGDERDGHIFCAQPRAELLTLRLQLCKAVHPAKHEVPLVANLGVVHEVAGVGKEAAGVWLRAVRAHGEIERLRRVALRRRRVQRVVLQVSVAELVLGC